jgi:outer membrane protein
MKKLATILLSLTLVSSLAAKTLVGQIDIQRVLLTVAEGKKVRNQLKASFDKKQGELRSEEEKIKKLQSDFSKQSMVLSDKAKAKKEQEMQKMIMQLQRTSMEYQKEIQAMEQSLKKPILDRVRTIVTEVSKNAGVDLTFEISTAPLIYAKDFKDLTPKVIELYDKRHPVKK